MDLCDIAQALRCIKSPDNEMFKYLVTKALSILVDGASGGTGAVLPQVSFAFGAVPAAYADTTLLDSTKRLRQLYIDNQTDSDIAISTDNGDTTSFTVLANSQLHRDLGNFIAAAQDDLQFKYLTAAPTSGSVIFDGSY